MGEMTIARAVQLAVGHHQAGRLAEAESIYRQILAVDPRESDALHMLGVIAHQVGQHETAAAFIARSIEVKPNNPAAHSNHGESLRALGRWQEARSCYERALTLQPDYYQAHNNLGIVMVKIRRLDEALRCFERALAIRPDYPDALNGRGMILMHAKRLEEACECFERALLLRPDYFKALVNLAATWQQLARLDEARRCLERAVTLQPDNAEAVADLSNLLREMGEIDAALALCRRAISLRPDAAWIGSNLIHSLHNDPATTATDLQVECQRWNRQYAVPLRALRRAHSNEADPDRRLRVGYVSADFWGHSISFFITPLLAAHDHGTVEVHGYATGGQRDEFTTRIRGLTDAWHEVMDLSDDALAEQIRADGIDILVDLSLHTGGNRLLVFARRPAPVQVSWLGHPGNTGLETIGYRLTDAKIEPVESDEERFSEQLVRLPDCWCCYDPLEEAPAVSALPALGNQGVVTFGSLNNFSKINEPTLGLWARVLQSVPASRLLLRCPPGTARKRVGSLLRERGGVEEERMQFVWREPTRQGYLRLYQGADLALDPSPYNGITTTCEALWMGVPVLTLPGKLPGSRASLSLLRAAGLDEFVAWTAEDFVRIAVSLAGDLPRLAALRAGLRERMKGSALMDAPRFARPVEAAYRMMWQRWCAEGWRRPEA